jgi:hypothetical protein
VGTAADTLARQGVGANGSVLMADSAQTNGIAWSTAQTSNRNKIINGGFDVWQRGTTGFTTGTYGPDRWYCAVNAGSGTFAQGTATPLVDGSQFFIRGTASGASTNLTIYTALETNDVFRLRNKVVVLSAYVRGSYTGNFILTADYSTSTDALTSQSTAIGNSGAVAVTTSFQRVSYSFTVPSDAKGLRLSVGCNATPMANAQTIDIWGVQLEVGSVATPFEFENFGVTLAKCQRYYQKGYEDGVYPGANGNTLGSAYIYAYAAIPTGKEYHTFLFPTRMRTAPTVTAYSYAGATNICHSAGVGDQGANSAVPASMGVAGCSILNSSGVSLASGGVYLFTYTASAEL